MRLVYQILVLVYLPLAIMAGMYVFQIDNLLTRLDDSIQADLKMNQAGVEDHFNLAAGYIDSIARLLAAGPEIADALHQGDTDLLFEKASSFVGEIADNVTFVDTKGVVIARGHDEFVFGDNLSSEPLVQQALVGKSASGFHWLENRFYLLSARPVRRYDEQIVGAVIVGMSAQYNFLGFVSMYHNVHIVMESAGKRVAFTSAPQELDDWDTSRFELSPQFGKDISVAIYQDNRQRRSQLRSLRNSMLSIASWLAIFLGVAATLIVRRVLRPMRVLVSTMRSYPDNPPEEPPLKEVGQAVEIRELSLAFFSMMRDLERKQASLEEAQDKYRSIFENSLAGMYRSTMEGRFIAANNALARMFGFELAEDFMNSIMDIANQIYAMPEQRDIIYKTLLRDGTLEDYEVEYKRRDGSRFWVSESCWIHRDETGEVLYIEGSFLDITERKRAEALEREKIAAEAASLAKSQFLASMSHEIRTPMNAVIGMAELLKETDLSPEQKQYMHIFEAASDSLLTLLGDILDITKVEAGQLELEHTPFLLRPIIATTCKVMAPPRP